MLKSINRTISAPAGLALAAFLVLPALAHDDESHRVMAGSIEISHGFARATLPNAPVGGGYVTLHNGGENDDRLVGAASPVSPDVQLHQMTVEDDVMRMSEVEGGIAVPAGETVTLKPGGLHLMFMQITEPFVEGTSIPVTLTFENAGTAEIGLEVRDIAAGAGHDMSHEEMDHDDTEMEHTH